MHHHTSLKFTQIVSCLVAILSLCGPVWAQNQALQAEPISLNFVNAEIETVARALANLTGRNLVVDPKVKGNMTLSTEKTMPPERAWSQFVSALRLQSIAVVEVNGLYKVLPEADAKLQAAAVIHGNHAVNPSGQVVTQIFSLKNENANQLLTVLRPLISPNNTINVTPDGNGLVITDYAENLHRLARIIANLDSRQQAAIEIFPLQHALAIDMAALLQRLLDSSGASQPATTAPGTVAGNHTTRITVLAEPRSNSLILRADGADRIQQARSLAAQLDRPGSTGDAGNIHVVYLKNADATKLAHTLRAALAADRPSGNGVVSGNPSGSNSANTTSGTNVANAANVSTTGGQIQADTATNSLIITAPEPVYRQLRAVIEQLDGRRAQVLVESLIAEVDASKAAQFGIQWQNAFGNRNGSVGILGTNFGTGGNNLLSLSQGTNLPGGGLNIGSLRDISGATVITSLANFLQQNGGSNILSTPTILTLDNEEAKIVVGQNVPFITGQYTANNSNAGAVNPFQTIERRDVGLTLKVKPQISASGTVKLSIYQEVSNVVGNQAGSSGLITNKRSIESNVLVEDGQVVVLGGLLSDSYTDNSDQVPGLGDVPVLGALFGRTARERKKSNLMVFLRPVVLRDVNALDQLSDSRYQHMLDLQRQSHLPANGVLPVDNQVTLPEKPEPRR